MNVQDMLHRFISFYMNFHHFVMVTKTCRKINGRSLDMSKTHCNTRWMNYRINFNQKSSILITFIITFTTILTTITIIHFALNHGFLAFFVDLQGHTLCCSSTSEVLSSDPVLGKGSNREISIPPKPTAGTPAKKGSAFW